MGKLSRIMAVSTGVLCIKMSEEVHDEWELGVILLNAIARGLEVVLATIGFGGMTWNEASVSGIETSRERENVNDDGVWKVGESVSGCNGSVMAETQP